MSRPCLLIIAAILSLLAPGPPAARAASPSSERPAAPRAEPRSRAAGAQDIYCGAPITRSVTLAQDLSDCPGTGLNVGAFHTKGPSKITIDLNGHSITGSRTKCCPGIIVVNSQRVTVKGPGTISGFDDCVRFQNDADRRGRGGHAVTGITCRDSADDGIQFIGNHGNRAVGNDIADVDGSGISLETSSNNRISGNRVSRAAKKLIEVGPDVLDFTAPGSHFNRISGNTLSDTDQVGVWILGSFNNAISGNRISDARTSGIQVLGLSRGNLISGNTIEGAASARGIYTSPDAFGNRAEGNAIRRNSVTGNGTDLLDGSGRCANTWKSNVFGTKDPDCIR